MASISYPGWWGMGLVIRDCWGGWGGGWVEVTAFPLARLLMEMKQSWLWGVGGIFCILLGSFSVLLD
jgi:hypothetical protein